MRRLTGSIALAAAALMVGMSNPVLADGAGTAKAGGTLSSFWAVPKEDSKMMIVVSGQPEPVTVAVTDKTIFGGICLHCDLPLEFKTGEAAKNCNVCGCVVSNAACIVGKPVKEGTWQAMMKALPRGVGLRLKYNTPDKPESGLSKLMVDLRWVLLPVTGLEGQTPDQLLALVKPLGGSQAELIDGGKRLSVRLKTDWTAERAGKLEKALVKLNAQVVVPEEPK